MEENKKLLLKDLCGRLPYHVKVYVDEQIPELVLGSHSCAGVFVYCGNPCKPYLFPLSSMTEEQKQEFGQLIELELQAINDEIDHTQATAFEVDFYNKYHLDWRGLIEKGLAIDATGLNIY